MNHPRNVRIATAAGICWLLLSTLPAPAQDSSAGGSGGPQGHLRFTNGREDTFVAVVPPRVFEALEGMALEPRAHLHPVFACSGYGEGYVWDEAECAKAGLADAGRYVLVSTQGWNLPPGEYYIAAGTRRSEDGFGEGYVSHHRRIQVQAGEVMDLEIPPPPQGYDQTEGTEWEYVCTWSCPWLYVHDGLDFERRLEIIRDLRGPELEGRQVAVLRQVRVVDGTVRLQIREELDECSFVDELALQLPDGTPLRRLPVHGSLPALQAQDGEYLRMQRGDVVELWFEAPATSTPVIDELRVISSGYYLPHACDPVGAVVRE